MRLAVNATDRGRIPLAVTLAAVSMWALTGCAIPRWPIRDSVTSPFGLRWESVVPGVHRGVDIRAPEGTPVRTMNSGRVRFAGWMNGYGNVVWIDHPGGVISVYAHLSDIGVRVGSPIETGEFIGASGSTGTVSGPHLHFEVWKRGRQIDPVRYLGGFP
jgi:murein DD-endopeptidase MepM/ murein hydrolase activator NlpD